MREFELQPGNHVLADELKNLQSELWKLYSKDERKWHQLSRAKWLAEGDRNTHYYHQLALARRRANHISKLVVCGKEVTEPVELKKAVKWYFEDIYVESDILRVRDIRCEFRTVSTASSERLERLFTEEEIWEVLRKCDGNKAPSADGFDAAFFKRYWSSLKG